MDIQDNGFTTLRRQILEQAVPLLDTSDAPVEERFQLSVQIAQTQGTLEAYERAFRIAQTIEAENRLGALMDLLGEVDYRIQESTPSEVPQEPAGYSNDHTSENHEQ